MLSDRYWLSSVAYQGGRGLDWREIQRANEAEFPDPDLTIGEIDSSISSFEVHGLKSRRVGRAKQVLGRLIDYHGFAGEVEVRELE